jgi:sugar/nucleoside kinase (ribokinase family)
MGCSLMADDGFCAQIHKAAELFHKLGARISFDPNIRPELLGKRSLSDMVAPIMKRCAILQPGLDELRVISGKSNIEDAASLLFENPVLEVIVLKLGSKGCRVITREDDFSISAYEIEPLDPTGAGDCFDAGFLCGLLDGMPPIDAARHAAAAAALNTAAFGPMEGDISPDSVQRLKGGNIR